MRDYVENTEDPKVVNTNAEHSNQAETRGTDTNRTKPDTDRAGMDASNMNQAGIGDLSVCIPASIPPEGYGTFCNVSKTPKEWCEEGDSISAVSTIQSGREKIQTMYEAMNCYLQAAIAEESVSILRRICKYVDEIISVTRTGQYQDIKEILKWAVFNLKLRILWKEAELMKNSKSPVDGSYIFAELRILSLIFEGKTIEDFQVVDLKRMSSILKRKFGSCF